MYDGKYSVCGSKESEEGGKNKSRMTVGKVGSDDEDGMVISVRALVKHPQNRTLARHNSLNIN